MANFLALSLFCVLLASFLVWSAPKRPAKTGKVNSITNVVDWKKAKASGPALTVYEHDYREPRQIHVAVVRIDLKTNGLRFAGSHRDPKWGEKMPEDVDKVQMVHSGFRIIMKGGENSQNPAEKECHKLLNRHNAQGTAWRRNAMNMGVYIQ